MGHRVAWHEPVKQKPNNFADKQRRLATVVALLLAVGCAALVALSFSGYGVGVPEPYKMAIAMLGNGLIALLCHRNVRGAAQLLPWWCAVFVPLTIVEPGITHHIDSAFIVVMLIAFGLSGPKTLVVLGFAPLVVLILRHPHPTKSPYFESSLWLITAVFVAILVALQRTFLAAQRTAQLTEQLTAAIAAASDDIVVMREPAATGDAIVRFISASAERMLGYPTTKLIDRAIAVAPLLHPDDFSEFARLEHLLIKDHEKSARAELRFRHRSGNWRWFEVRSVRHLDVHGTLFLVSALRDINDEREMREQQACEMEYQAQHDALTALPNRWRLTRDLADSGANSALLFCDVDSFKHVNDSLGHDVGDELLCAVANRLRPLTTPTCRLYRFGGDEFVFLLRNEHANAATASALADAILATTRDHLTIGANRVVLTMSVGIAVAESGENAEDLVRNADLAMYAAKTSGKNQCHVFDSEMKQQVQRRHVVEQALRGALAANEMRLVYQPKISIKPERCVGFEALLRWQSSALGEVSPGEFIPIAEETGLIIDLGHFALRTACMEMAQQHIDDAVSVSVNVSIGQLADPARLRASVHEGLQASGLAPSLLELEITESLFMKRPEAIVATLQSLRQLGVRIAVDDFGTGYSSLAYLSRFPIDGLKIDRTFVKQMNKDHASRAIIAAILALSRELGLRTIAEGVESRKEIDALASLGCDEAQGFVIARPMPLRDALMFARTYCPVAENADVSSGPNLAVSESLVS